MNKQNYPSVIIVDDSKFSRTHLKNIILKNGITTKVWEFENGFDAFMKFSEIKPDLILMDILMPEMNGVEAIKKIHALNPTVKIIVLTSSNDKHHKEDALRFGADMYLKKPFDRNELPMKITKILKDKALDDSRRSQIKKLGDNTLRIDR